MDRVERGLEPAVCHLKAQRLPVIVPRMRTHVASGGGARDIIYFIARC